jgi:flagellar biosynthesis/type III secretory pathway M-ring protein FliF/YscJ
MSMVIVLEVIVAIVVLAAAVRFAVRDTRQRRDASPQQRVESGDAGEAQPSGSEREADQHPIEVADQREGDEVAALSSTSTGPEPSTETR